MVNPSSTTIQYPNTSTPLECLSKGISFKIKTITKYDGSSQPSGLKTSSPTTTKTVEKQEGHKSHTSHSTKYPPTPSKRKYVTKKIDSDDEDNAPLLSKFPNLKSDKAIPTVQMTSGDEGQGSSKRKKLVKKDEVLTDYILSL